MSKIALVTGGSRGIGAACAELFYQKGMTVAIGYHKAERAAKELAERMPGCIAVRADVSDPHAVGAMVEQVTDRFGRIDVLVNSAGIAHYGLFTDLSDADWADICGVNLSGTLYCCRAVLPGMIAQKSGSIINISSMWGECGASCEVAYSAAKAGVIGLTKALAKEVGLSGVRVNCITPGVIATDMTAILDEETKAALSDETPLGRLGSAAEVAQAAYYLASDGASFVTGQVLGVNGGLVV